MSAKKQLLLDRIPKQSTPFAELLQKAKTSVNSEIGLDQLVLPRWYKPWQFWTNPCNILGCKTFHESAFITPVMVVFLSGCLCFLITIALLAAVGFVSLGFWEFAPLVSWWFKVWPWMIYSFGLTVTLFPVCHTAFGVANWNFHRAEIAEKRQKLMIKPPAELLVGYLQTELATMRDRILGDRSNLIKHRRLLEEKRALLMALAERFSIRVGVCSEGSHKEALKKGEQEARALVAAVLESEDSLKRHLARLEAYFAECEAKIAVIRDPIDDLKLFEELSMHREESATLLASAEDAVVESVEILHGEMETFEGKLAQFVPAATAELAGASNAELSEVLQTCDSLLTAAFAELPSSNGSMVA